MRRKGNKSKDQFGETNHLGRFLIWRSMLGEPEDEGARDWQSLVEQLGGRWLEKTEIREEGDAVQRSRVSDHICR